MIDPAFTGMACATLALVFLASAWGKARHPRWFAGALREYRLLPEVALWPVALAVPALEAAAALGLLAAPLRPLAAALALVLLGVFSAALGLNLARGRRDIDCGCWGPAARPGALSGWLLARNAALAVLAAVLLMPPAGRDLVWVDFLTVGLGTVALLFVFGAIDRLIAQAPALADLRHRHEEIR